MEVINTITDIERIEDGVITVGTFDGIHSAHLAIIQRVIDYAKKHGLKSSVITFNPHPRQVIVKENGKPLELLTTIDEKITLLKSFSIDRLIVIPFTREFSRTPPENFITDVLCEKIGMKHLIIGYDHGFGKNRSGDIDFLRKYEKKCGFTLEVQGPISHSLGAISSTAIRTFLRKGEVDNAAKFLSRPYHLTGTVTHGDGRGKSIHYPTANIQPYDEYKCIPANGVYVVGVKIGNDSYSGIMNVGVRPTFGNNTSTLEVHIFDFDRTIYGADVMVEFLTRVRSEKKFDSAVMLKEQIDTDASFAREYLAKIEKN
ncbi:bifunctional riboflavin kinase/FAD synthetase [candidate division KSB1 bacterium]